ncbi:MAG TPA: cytochrome P450 [Acidimicrobiales bacterium]|jgi:cytochrome P450|nr:cytochrome P450 [Acidimicrobiales bacterium]
MTDRRPVVDFDHHAPDFDARVAYGRLRRTCPVAWTEAHGGFWVVSRHEDVSTVARQDATFSSGRDENGHGGIVIPEWNTETSIPIEMDPPESVPYRRMLNALLHPRAVEHMKPMIADVTTEVIDVFIEAGRCDLINDLTSPVAALVVALWIGFPRQDWKPLAQAVHDVFGSAPGTERAARGKAGMQWMVEEVHSLVHERRADPRDDVVSFLCAQQIEGRPLGDDEVVSMVKLLVGGGMDTTTSLTGQTLVHLCSHTEHRKWLRQDPSVLVSATEEFLRVFAPSQSMGRTATADVELGQCAIRKGDRVLLPWVAANFDEGVFDEPDQVVLDRPGNRHTSFGLGSHRCVGSHLARAMFQEMIRQVLERIPDYRVLTDRMVPYASHGNQTGWDSLPAVFTPGPRRGAGATSAPPAP